MKERSKSHSRYSLETIHTIIILGRLFTGVIIGTTTCYWISFLNNPSALTLLKIITLFLLFSIIAKTLEACFNRYLLKKIQANIN